MTQGRLREVRQQRGMSIAELARRTGFHPSAISKLESGNRKLTRHYSQRIAEVLGMKEEELTRDHGRSEVSS